MDRLFVLLFCSTAAWSQPYPQAHAHNDYEHNRPLFDALANGFTSVEADIFLINGKLLVAHTRLFFHAKSLEELYLAPLDSIVCAHQGRVYREYAKPFFLMIDIKSNGDEVYPVLMEALQRHPSLLPRRGSEAPVVIYLSGDRPLDKVFKDPASRVALDGRPLDLGKGYSPLLMPVISDNFNKWSTWNGKGLPPADEFQKIKVLSKQVHAEGKRLRFWAIPDNPVTWDALLDAGVDIINTDNLEGLCEFLKLRK